MVVQSLLMLNVPARCEFLVKQYAENLSRIAAAKPTAGASLEVLSGFALSLVFAGLEADDVREVSAEDLRLFIITVMQAAIAHDEEQRQKASEVHRPSVSPSVSSDERAEITAFNAVYDGLLLPFGKNPKSKKEVN